MHSGVARDDCPSVQRALTAPDCTPCLAIKGSNTSARSRSYLVTLRVLFQ